MRSRLGDNSRQKLSEVHQQRLILSAKQYTSGLLEKNGFFFCSSSGVMMQSNTTRPHISEKAQRWFLSNSAFPMREKHFSAYWFIYMHSSTHKNCTYMDSSFSFSNNSGIQARSKAAVWLKWPHQFLWWISYIIVVKTIYFSLFE